MTEQEQHASVFMSMKGEFSLMDVVSKLNSQDEKINEIRNRLAQIGDIKESVTRLVTESSFRRDDFQKLATIDRIVQGQVSVQKLLTAMCILLFPSILAWAVYITNKVMAMDLQIQLQQIRMQNWEKSNANSLPNPSEYEQSRYFWDIESKRFIKF